MAKYYGVLDSTVLDILLHCCRYSHRIHLNFELIELRFRNSNIVIIIQVQQESTGEPPLQLVPAQVDAPGVQASNIPRTLEPRRDNVSQCLDMRVTSGLIVS